MSKDLTLVVMAAGMGSRFGGPKQITPIGPNGEFLIDYSVNDAIIAGFTKVVFIIKKEHRKVFDETITRNLRNRIKVEYAYQDLFSYVPNDADIPADRTKPWGTTHAVLCAKEFIDGPFAIINADDFYGRDAYVKAADFLRDSRGDDEGACIAYPFGQTASQFGSVKRGVLLVEDGYVCDIKESKVTPVGDLNECVALDGSETFYIEDTHPVSMNFFCFKKSFLELLKKDFYRFIYQDSETLKTAESLIPQTVKKYIKSGDIVIECIETTGDWTGMTYQEDLPELKKKIEKFIDEKVYPQELWT